MKIISALILTLTASSCVVAIGNRGTEDGACCQDVEAHEGEIHEEGHGDEAHGADHEG